MDGLGANILAASLVIAALLLVMGVVYMLWSQQAMKKKREFFQELHASLRPGQDIMFCGGIYGTIEDIIDDRVTVRVRDGVRLDISRYSIQNIQKEEQPQ